MESPTSSQETALSSAVTDPEDFFDSLRTARGLIAAYGPSSPRDYTVALLTAILDNRAIIGHLGVQNVLNDIVREGHNIAGLAEHYMTSIYFPRIPLPTIVEITTTDTA